MSSTFLSFLFFISISFLPFLSFATIAPSLTDDNVDDWVLVWEDDFPGTSINKSNWVIWNNRTHCAPCEAELYVDYAVSVGDGVVKITTTREQVVGPNGTIYNYTSGWITTENLLSWMYGRFQVRAKLPPQNASGSWPAHWLMPQSGQCWPTGGEIDIMEATPVSEEPVLYPIYGSYRWGTECGVDNQPLPGGEYPPLGADPIDWSADFHIFSVDWNTTHLQFAVDGNYYETKTSDQVIFPTFPMYWIINTAIAWYAPHPPWANYPTTHIIDWVRVYQQQPSVIATE